MKWSFGGRQRFIFLVLLGVLITLATTVCVSLFWPINTHLLCGDCIWEPVQTEATARKVALRRFTVFRCHRRQSTVQVLSSPDWLRQICAGLVHVPCWPCPGTSWTWGIVGRSLFPSGCRFLLALRWGWSETDPLGFAWSSPWFDDQYLPAGITDTVLQGKTQSTTHTHLHTCTHTSLGAWVSMNSL